MRRLILPVPVLLVLVLLVLGPGPVFSGPPVPAEPPHQDRHEGYYYPPVTSREVYTARAPVLTDSDRERRLGFIVGLTRQQMDRAYAPTYAIFAKGEQAEKLIIVALNRDSLVTLFQARALLAQLTSMARATPIFVDNQVEDTFTFLDLLRMLGFEQVTISDGQTYAHQIRIE